MKLENFAETKRPMKPSILEGEVRTSKDTNIDLPLTWNSGDVDIEDAKMYADFNRKENLTPLTDEYKEKLKAETGWSDEIIDAIGSQEEAEIYKNSGLIEAEVNGQKCLIRTDIDMDQKDEFGRTNKERMQEGKAPLDKDGKPIELHHIGQKSDAPLAELKREEHRGKGNDAILHDKNKNSEIDREVFATQRTEHWKSRSDNA
jgi:hypothetical protein